MNLGKSEQKFLEEAIRIGNQILLDAKESHSGIFWEVLAPTGERMIRHSLYNGSAGIILFLVELYNVTQDEVYLEGALKGAEWLMKRDDVSIEESLAFYTGEGGVIFCFLRLYSATNKKIYKEYALQIARRNASYFEYRYCDILSGVSGSVLTLLHLYDETREEWLLLELSKKIEVLIDRIIVSKNGFCWDRLGESIHPLCGFSHGVSGIAFVFFELYRYFGNEVFAWIARNALSYEDSYYNSEERNWPDFRKDTITEEGIKKLLDSYHNGQFEEFQPWYMSAWCHGAPGIGQVRLQAYILTQNTEYAVDFANCIENIDRTWPIELGHVRDYTLCHGVLGDMMLLMEGYLQLKDQKLINNCVQWAERAIYSRTKVGYYSSGFPKVDGPADSSLFVGLSGIGLFYLKIIKPHKVYNILCPKIENSKSGNAFLNFSIGEISNRLAKRTFPNSALVLTSNIPMPENLFYSSHFRNQMNDCIEEYSKVTNDDVLHKMLERDRHRFIVFDEIQNDVLLKIEWLTQQKKNQSGDIYTDEIFYNKNMIVNVFGTGNTKTYQAILPTFQDYGVVEFRIGKFQYDIVQAFKRKSCAKTVFNDFLTEYDIDNENDFWQFYIHQLVNCVNLGFLHF